MHLRCRWSFCLTTVLLVLPIALRAQTTDTNRVFTAAYPRSLTVEPGDVLHVRIWREPDLSGDFAVAEDGTVVLPKLGPTRAATISPDSLRRQLIKSYSEFLRNPSIDIAIGRRISVLGHVKAPGSYRVDPTETVADLLTAAGGLTGDADPKSVHIARHDTTLLRGLAEDATVADLRLNSGDELVVDKRRFTISVRGVYATATATLALIYLSIRTGLLKKF